MTKHLTLIDSIKKEILQELKYIKKQKLKLKIKLMLTLVLPIVIILLTIKVTQTYVNIKLKNILAPPVSREYQSIPRPAKTSVSKPEFITPQPVDTKVIQAAPKE